MNAPIPVETHPLFVGGEWLETPVRRTIRLPYDGTLVGEMCEADEALLERAITAAQRGARAMAALSAADRAGLLERLGALVARDARLLATTIALESGKPIREARGEVERAAATLAASALAARELSGEVIPMDAFPSGAGRMAITVREPLGVIGAITPFNFPLNLALHKVGPALAAGNAVVHKPAEQTPLSGVRLARLMEEAGAPAGAYNLAAGDGETIGRRLVEDERLAMITFTGSVEVGRRIRAAAGLKKVTLELGGNSGLIVEPDADVARASERAVAGGFGLSGQSCVSVQRVYAHESIFDEFVDRMRAGAEKLVMGHPLEDSTEISSLITIEDAVRVAAWIEEAVEFGATLVTGGARRRATLTPAVLTGVPDGVRLSCQEVFGPVVAVNRYRDLEEAIVRVNATRYGLQAGIFTRDLERAFRAARKIEAGGVMINEVPTYRADHMPYGGVKESGLGREGPRYAAAEMTDVKIICWRV